MFHWGKLVIYESAQPSSPFSSLLNFPWALYRHCSLSSAFTGVLLEIIPPCYSIILSFSMSMSYGTILSTFGLKHIKIMFIQSNFYFSSISTKLHLCCIIIIHGNVITAGKILTPKRQSLWQTLIQSLMHSIYKKVLQCNANLCLFSIHE